MTWFTRFNFSILHVNEVIIEWLVLVVLVDLQGVVLVVVPHSAGGGWVVSQGLTQHPQHHRHTGHQHHGLLTGHRSLVHRSWSWPGDRRGGESGSVRRGVRRMRRCLPPAPTATLSWLTVLVQDQHSQLCSSLLQPAPACSSLWSVLQGYATSGANIVRVTAAHQHMLLMISTHWRQQYMYTRVYQTVENIKYYKNKSSVKS